MARPGASSISFPAFRGITRLLVLVNLAAYFLVLLAGAVAPEFAAQVIPPLCFVPSQFLHGWLWQPLTYSFVHSGILWTFSELVSLWFLSGFLEQMHSQSWTLGLYASSVLGTAVSAVAIHAVSGPLGLSQLEPALYGCFGGIFGMLVAIGVLYGEMEFLLLLTIPIKARYIAVIYGLVAVAMMFGALRMYAFAQLGGALAGYLFILFAPRRGLGFVVSEQWFGLRNRYYRWKRRKAAKKFEVYMRSQGRTVRFDGQGRQLDEDPDDKKRWN